MHRGNYLIFVAVILILLAALLHYVHYLIFRDWHHVFIYMMGDIAFVPLEVLLVVIVVERLLHNHEKQTILDKLNMVIGVFFSELGNRLFRDLIDADAAREQTRKNLAPNMSWQESDFVKALDYARNSTFEIDINKLDLKELRDLIADKRDLLVRLLENPNLLEHERFTDLLWAIFHLGEELSARDFSQPFPASDLEHLKGDTARVYSQLVIEWINYSLHLKNDYPYLFSLLARTHPLREAPSATVT